MQQKISLKFLSVVTALVLTVGAVAQAQSPRLYASTGQLRTLLSRIETRTDAFKSEVQRTFRNDGRTTDREDRIEDLIGDFENATDSLRVRTDGRQTLTGEVDAVFRQALRVNTFASRNQLSSRAQSQWMMIRNDLNTLASYYRLTWNWNEQTYPTTGNNGTWTNTNSSVQPPTLYATTRQVQNLLSRIKTRTDAFEYEVQRNANNDGRVTSREDRITDLIADFENATNTLDVGIRGRQNLTGEVDAVFRQALRINNFASRTQLSSRAQSQWAAIRTDLNTLASYYRLSWNWNQTVNSNMGNNTGTWSDSTPGNTAPVQPPVLYASTQQVQTLLARIKTQTDAFRIETSRTFSNDSRVTNSEDRLSDLIADFENATDTLNVGVMGRQTLTGEVDAVFRQAMRINNFANRSQLSSRAQSQWSTIRTDLTTLASYYRLSWDWNQQGFPATGSTSTFPNSGPNGQLRIEGTYRLDQSRSDNVSQVVERTIGNNANNAGIERRLASPDVIAIDARGTSVTLATSNAAQASFEANGTANRETNPRGRTITTTATLRNNRLEINQEGDRVNDFNVVFQSTGSDQLTVTKRLYLEGRNETVTVRSVYTRVSSQADWNAVNSARGGNNNNDGTINDFFVPNGTRLTARLDNTINTRASQVGDRVSLTVVSPSQYNGAVIEGRLIEAENSGRVSGRANVSFSFDTLRMNGRTYNFAGIIDSVRAANGDSVSVNNEGTIRDNNQTTKTATRAGIGAILGAIIGGITGGGSGAAIGATVGAGAGAGTVLISGRDTLELGPGSTFEITASAPGNARVSRY